MNIKANDARRPVSIVVIGAGNRTNKYLEYAKINPDKVQLVGVVELNDIRRNKVAERFGLDASQCCSDYKTFSQSCQVGCHPDMYTRKHAF